jgi:hypothetical protein
MRKIAHIINPVKMGLESDLAVAQPITFETMRIAKEYAQDTVEVELYSAQFAEDRTLVPHHLVMTPNLQRSVLDIGTFQIQRKLPLIKDILDRLFEATQADYLIYTNVDIALMPHFYVAVNHFIDSGYDAFAINRRIISKAYHRIEDIPAMFAQVGQIHPGYDCFIFKRSVYHEYQLGAACIGTKHIGKVLLLNLWQYATNFAVFTDLHATFHIGQDKPTQQVQFANFHLHNERTLKQILSIYRPLTHLDVHPAIKQFAQMYGPTLLRQQATQHLRRVGRQLIGRGTRRWVSLLSLSFLLGLISGKLWRR